MKQRLVGTLVLGSLALILIPLILDGEGVERPPLSGSIPPAPVFDTAPLPEPERPTIVADSFAPAAEALEPEASVASDAPADSVPAPDPAAAAVAPDSETAATPASTETASTEPASTETASTEPAAIATPAATPAPASPEPAAQSASAPALDAAGLPEGWVVRVGVFGEKANAERLTARLVADNYKAFIRPVGVSSGVFIGPVATQDEASALRRQLNDAKAKYQTGDASVQRYDIGQ